MADFQVYQDNRGQFSWRLVASNGNTVACCASFFSNEIECYKSAEFVKRFAPFANINTIKEPDPLSVES